jgi:hypothetical protein
MKWEAGLIMLGALYLVTAHPTAIVNGLGGLQKFISGTEATAIGR